MAMIQLRPCFSDPSTRPRAAFSEYCHHYRKPTATAGVLGESIRDCRLLKVPIGGEVCLLSKKQNGERAQMIQTSSYKVNKSWGCVDPTPPRVRAGSPRLRVGGAGLGASAVRPQMQFCDEPVREPAPSPSQDHLPRMLLPEKPFPNHPAHPRGTEPRMQNHKNFA